MTTPSTAARLLLVCDDDPTRAFLSENLTADGLATDAVENHNAALAHLRTTAVDLAVIDANGNSLDLLDAVRESDLLAVPSDLPAVVLVAERDPIHVTRLLERGADDVVAKPFAYPELRARVWAVLRRTGVRQPAPILRAGPLRIDLRRREVTVDDQPVELSALEYALACKLASDPTRVFTRQELMLDIWGYHTTTTRTLDSHACRLRAKLTNPDRPLITNVWGVGYRLLANPAC